MKSCYCSFFVLSPPKKITPCHQCSRLFRSLSKRDLLLMHNGIKLEFLKEPWWMRHPNPVMSCEETCLKFVVENIFKIISFWSLGVVSLPGKAWVPPVFCQRVHLHSLLQAGVHINEKMLFKKLRLLLCIAVMSEIGPKWATLVSILIGEGVVCSLTT